MAALFKFMRNNLSVVAITVAFIWSMVAISMYRAKEAPKDAITLRIGHWQLETSVRDAFNEMAADYRRDVNPNVYIIQDAIPETTYGQWCSTQLMGGTAPDMVEIWKGLPYPIWVSYLNRYFVPLSREVNKPNPYNKGTDLQGVPLRKTYLDGLRYGYVEELQEYMMVGLSQFTVRIYYNKDLFRKLTGKDTPTTDYRQFLKDCDTIKSHKDPKGRPFVPIASSTFHFGMWEGMVFDIPTYGALKYCDFNHDGFVSNDELYAAVQSGRFSLMDPCYEAKFKLLRQVSAEFEDGYTGLTRDEAVFLFAQERAVFMPTGTWDARSLQEQAKGKFEIGVLDFPIPSRNDPEFGRFVEGPVYDRPGTAIAIAINRTCKHQDIALDFLRYLASRKGNEKFNDIVGWIPAIRGAKMQPFLENFKPHLEGIYGCINIFLGGETSIRWAQLYSLYQVNQISFKDLMAQYIPFYKEKGMHDYLEVQKDWRRGMVSNEQFLTGIRAKALTQSGPEGESAWVKYRALTAGRQVGPEIGHSRQMVFVEKGPDPKAVGPYEYNPKVLALIRQNLKKR